MILVILGTWKMPFIRALKEIEELVRNGNIKEEVIVQSGHTSFNSTHLKIIPFLGKSELELLYQKATFVISQAGIGSIMMGLKNNKKVISIARKREFDEHIDDHQEEILDLFYKQNFVMKWNGNGDLIKLINLVPEFIPNKYPFAEEQISSQIIKYINNEFRK